MLLFRKCSKLIIKGQRGYIRYLVVSTVAMGRLVTLDRNQKPIPFIQCHQSCNEL